MKRLKVILTPLKLTRDNVDERTNMKCANCSVKKEDAGTQTYGTIDQTSRLVSDQIVQVSLTPSRIPRFVERKSKSASERCCGRNNRMGQGDVRPESSHLDNRSYGSSEYGYSRTNIDDVKETKFGKSCHKHRQTNSSADELLVTVPETSKSKIISKSDNDSKLQWQGKCIKKRNENIGETEMIDKELASNGEILPEKFSSTSMKNVPHLSSKRSLERSRTFSISDSEYHGIATRSRSASDHLRKQNMKNGSRESRSCDSRSKGRHRSVKRGREETETDGPEAISNTVETRRSGKGSQRRIPILSCISGN